MLNIRNCMKNLAKLALIAGLSLSSFSLHSEEFKFPTETNRYKFIPSDDAPVIWFKYNTKEFGNLLAIWYCPECKSLDDYEKRFKEKKGEISDEIYVDINQDGIVDDSLSDLIKLASEYLERENKRIIENSKI
jgi:hypothetical protein